MELDALLPSRLQFAFNIGLHILFPSLTVGLASFLAVLKGLWLATGRQVFQSLYVFWFKAFAASLGLAMVSVLWVVLAGGRTANGLSLEPERLAHAALAACLATALAVAAASAWRLIRDPADEASCMALRMAVGTVAILAPIQLLADELAGRAMLASLVQTPTVSDAAWVLTGMDAAMIALALWGGWLAWRGQGLERSRPFLWACLAMAPAGFVAAAIGSSRAMPKPMPKPTCRLYLITPPRLDDLAAFGRELAHALDAGDVAALQIRLKDVSEEIVAAAVDVLSPIAQARGVAVILNDRPDLAARLGCDGAHVGREDMSVRDARKIMGPDGMVGATCHDSRHMAMEAAEQGADYVAFGAFFPTTTKDASTHAEPELLTIWQETMEIPCVAIGGITVETARELAKAGADFLAVSAGVWAREGGPATAVAAFNAEIAAGLAERG
jgi:thiamine-phosphate pyrophosphorylase